MPEASGLDRKAAAAPTSAAVMAWGKGEPIQATLAYHWARMIEMLHSIEVIKELLDDPDILSGELMASGPRRRSGVGVIEAPRGTLYYRLEISADGTVKKGEIIVPTGQNQIVMEKAIYELVEKLLAQKIKKSRK